MNISRRIQIFVLLVLFLLSLSACAKEEAVSTEPLEVAVDNWPGFMPAVLADELGYFAEEGVDVKVIYSENARQQRLEFESGAYDGITLSLGSLIAVSSKAPDTRIIFLTDISTTGDAVVAAPGIKSAADLKGKRIVLGAAGYGEVVVNVMLEEAGLTSNDVIWVAMQDENEALEMLKDGRADAFQTWEPYVGRAVGNGAKIIFTGADVPGLIPDAIGFHEATLRERPEDVTAFTRAWFRAVDYWLANPDDAAQIISSAVSLSPEEVSLNGLELLTLEENQNFFVPGDDFSSAYYAANVYMEFFVKNGVIDTPLNIEEILDPTFLNQLP